MRYVPIDRVKEGMYLARPILDDMNRVLLGMETPLSQELIDRVVERGFSGLYIEDELSKGIVIEEAITSELRNKGVMALKAGDLDKCLEVAKGIVAQILESENITLDMLDLRSYDDYIYRHSINVCVLSTIIGMGMNLKREELVDLSIAAILHDLGKLNIDPEILNKVGKLTPEEFEIVKTHAKLSYEMIKDKIGISAKVKAGVLYHHENENGSGYPFGVEGKDIHVFAKIIHVADVYDALTSKRTYKKPFALAEAIEYLMGGCDILFSKEIVDVFLKSVPIYPKGITIALSNGEEALIIKNSENPLRPIVRLVETGEDINLNNNPDYKNVTIAQDTKVDTNFSEEFMMLQQCNYAKKRTVIIVNRSEGESEALRKMLSSEYEIIPLQMGQQIVKYLKEHKWPDLIVVDMVLDDMNGIEAIRRVREQITETIPVIFMAEGASRELVMKCKEMQAKDYIVKPYQATYILERIKIALN